MGDDDQGGAGGIQRFEQGRDFLAGGAVEVAGGFVGQQHRRAHDRGAGDRHALALAAGKFVGAVVGARLEAEILQGPLHACAALGHRDAGQHQRQGDVLGGGQARHQMEALEHEADARAAHRRLFVGRQGRDVAAFEAVMAAVRAVEQAEQVQQGGLARTGRAHDCDVLAGLDAQRHVVQRMHLAVAEPEDALDAFQFDLRHALLRASGRRLRC